MATPTGSASMGTANGNPNRGWESAVFSWPASYDHDHTSLNGDLNNYTLTEVAISADGKTLLNIQNVAP